MISVRDPPPRRSSGARTDADVENVENVTHRARELGRRLIRDARARDDDDDDDDDDDAIDRAIAIASITPASPMTERTAETHGETTNDDWRRERYQFAIAPCREKGAIRKYR